MLISDDANTQLSEWLRLEYFLVLNRIFLLLFQLLFLLARILLEKSLSFLVFLASLGPIAVLRIIWHTTSSQEANPWECNTKRRVLNGVKFV